MNFGETDEQQMIRELVRDFAETVLAPTVEHRDQNQIPPTEEWAAFLEYGLHGITIPEAYGGSPIDDVSEAIIIEELHAPTLLLGHVLRSCRSLRHDDCATR